MEIKVLQLNLFANQFKKKLFPFLEQRNFDIYMFQEITGPNTQFGNIISMEDNYEDLKKLLGEDYASELLQTDTFSIDPASYFANAIFYKKDCKLLDRKEVFMRKNDKPFPSELKTYEALSRAILSLELEKDGKQFTAITSHFAWGGKPIEQEHQTKQGEIMMDFFDDIQKPFVFGADMNLNPDQPIIQKLSEHSRNLISEHGITNTLNPRLHKAQHMFPKGAAVDYLFVSEDINVKSFEVLEDDLSDHKGLVANIAIT